MIPSRSISDRPALVKSPKILVAAISVLLTGCESAQRDAFIEQSSQWFERSGEMIHDFSRNLTATGDDQELEALFDQPYIDPLTRYLEKNRTDSELRSQLSKVTTERDRRCSLIAKRFNQLNVTSETVERFRRGYSYSCPNEVALYTQRLEKQPVSLIQKRPESLPPESEPASPVIASARDCYLLTSIRNYSEALKLCRLAAEQQDIRSQANMAQIYYALEQYDDAVRWAKIATDQSPDATFLLGNIYEHGLGVSADLAAAIFWYRRAKTMGHPKADAALTRLQGS